MIKKGFTLIELLAVIIILAIVVLIATPIVLDVVNDAKDSAAKSEASMIVSGINNYCATAAMKEQLDGTISICNDGVTRDEVKTMVDLGNAKVNEIEYVNGKVSKLEIESNGRTVKYNGSEYILGLAYYAFGLPTTSSTTNYQNVIETSGSNVFVKLFNGQLSVCINRNNELECFKYNNFSEENKNMQNVFGTDSCTYNNTYFYCSDANFGCDGYSDGYVYCGEHNSGHNCYIRDGGIVDCR